MIEPSSATRRLLKTSKKFLQFIPFACSKPVRPVVLLHNEVKEVIYIYINIAAT